MMMRMMMLACRTNIILKDNLAMLNLVNNTEANTSCRIKEGNIIAGIFVYQGIRATIVKTISFSNV